MKTLHVKLERKNISSLVVDHALICSRVLIEKKIVALILSVVYQAVIIHYLKMIYNKKVSEIMIPLKYIFVDFFS